MSVVGKDCYASSPLLPRNPFQTMRARIPGKYKDCTASDNEERS